MIEGFFQTEQNMFAIFGLGQIELRATADDIDAMKDEFMENRLERQCLWDAMDERHGICMKTLFKLSVLIKEVKDLFRICTLLEVHSDAHVLVGLVTQTFDTFYDLFSDKISNLDDQFTFVHAERDRCNDDLKLAFFVFDDLSFTSHSDAAASGGISVMNIFFSIYNGPGWKIRPFDELEQIFGRGFLIINEMNRSIDDFAQIVRSDVGSHTDRNAKCSIQKQVRNCRRQNGRLFARTVIVGTKIYCILIDLTKKLAGNAGHFCLRITHRCRRVTVNSTEVTLAMNQWITHSERLGHLDQGFINSTVAVRMVVTHRVSNHHG